MAIYRNIQMSFWTDSKVADDMTPEDKYFYLYLLTNPHTNLAGCYELSLRHASFETGYTKETIERLVDRFEKVHRIVCYSKETKEILLLNWSRYNWTASEKFRKPLEREINAVKCPEFKGYLWRLFGGEDTVSIPYQYGSDTTVTVTDTVTDTVKKKEKPVKHKYGEYKNVLLTDDEHEKLSKEFRDIDERIERLSEYVASTGKSYKSHYATIRAWARKDTKPQQKATKFSNYEPQREKNWDDIEARMIRQSMGL